MKLERLYYRNQTPVNVSSGVHHFRQSMQSELPSKWPLLIVCMVGILSVVIILFYPIFDTSVHNAHTNLSSLFNLDGPSGLNMISATSVASASNMVIEPKGDPPSAKVLNREQQSGIGLPIRLKIPQLKVDAVLEYVGVMRDKELGVPKNIADAAWFNQSPRPGEVGVAVIDGHYGWQNNVPAVFDKLHTLHKGDRVIVEDENGTSITFKVHKLTTFDQNADVSTTFGSTDGKAHLNLITCDGTWNTDKKSYPNRLIVFANRVE